MENGEVGSILTVHGMRSAVNGISAFRVKIKFLKLY